MERYLSQAEAAEVLSSHTRPLRVLVLQSWEASRLLADGTLTASQGGELQATVRRLIDHQSNSERIKDLPFPRQHAFINSLFVRICVSCFLSA